ncbi:hypothetical protein [Pleomorphomonas sp. JP5]|uniref:hypothetical protein n=1 Tax=Pleomorphomonas sp. JP5 TaxID=2942998 RepID=UPI002042E558|nr:hypothetical protein [Pleomorphomonas sp. JP5]MCM5558627.1 hypothetical protein [Pleomorphomonas sp. JP5]
MRTATILRLTVALTLGTTYSATAASFIARPTEPMSCSSGGKLWQGYFHGRKEVESGWKRYEDVSERYCFKTEKLCRNWLYNMQSEYTYMVWSAVCAPMGK